MSRPSGLPGQGGLGELPAEGQELCVYPLGLGDEDGDAGAVIAKDVEHLVAVSVVFDELGYGNKIGGGEAGPVERVAGDGDPAPLLEGPRSVAGLGDDELAVDIVSFPALETGRK